MFPLNQSRRSGGDPAKIRHSAGRILAPYTLKGNDMPRSATANVDVHTGVLVGASGPRKRRFYRNDFERLINTAANVAINGSFDEIKGNKNLESDQDFIISGTNFAEGNVTHSTSGGLVLTTTDAAANQCVIFPLTATDVDTGFSNKVWDTGAESACEWGFTTDSRIDNQIIFAGLKITDLSAEYSTATGTDDNQVYVDYIAGSNNNKFLVRYSYGGTDVTIDSGLTMVASTSYWVKIAFDSSKYVDVFIGNSDEPGAATHIRSRHAITADGLSSSTGILTLKPTFGIQQTTTDQAIVNMDYVACGRNR